MASSPAMRETALLMPDATPASLVGTDSITAVVSGGDADGHADAENDDWWEKGRPVGSSDARPEEEREAQRRDRPYRP